MRALAITALLVLCASVAAAQTVATEVDITAGYSTEDVSAAATQIRAFGEVRGGIRFFGEAAWGARYFTESRPKSATDVFGAAYPYQNRPQLIEAYGERTFNPGQVLSACGPAGFARRSASIREAIMPTPDSCAPR
jgi:hypothetical protein